MPKARDDQPSLPQSEDVKNERVHKTALVYRHLMRQRKAAGEKEKEAKDKLISVMEEEGIEIYKYGDIAIYLDSLKTVRITDLDKKKSEDGEE